MFGTLGIDIRLLYKGAMYVYKREKQPSSKIYIWRSFVQVQSAVSPNILNTEQELNSQLSISPSTHQFSWISLLREVLMLFSVTRLGNLSSSFLCVCVCHVGLSALSSYPLFFCVKFYSSGLNDDLSYS